MKDQAYNWPDLAGQSTGLPPKVNLAGSPTGPGRPTDTVLNDGRLDQIAVKVCELITENEAFCQIVTDAVSLAFQKNLVALEEKVKNLQDENKSLKKQIEAQEQYSRRNCLLIHSVPAVS